MNSLLVSVIIPVYNRADILSRAISSVVKQTYENFELIIVDDCSTDNTEAVVRAFKDNRIIYIRHPQNKGAAAARNTGMSKAQGELLAFLDSDDEFLPEKLEKQVEVFKELPEDTGLILTNMRVLGKHKRFFVSEQITSGYLLSSSSFPASIFLPPSTWMLRKNCIVQVGQFDEMIFGIEDADYFTRILQKFRVYFLNQALSIKHISVRAQKRQFSSKYFCGKEHFLKKHFESIRRDRKYLSRFYYGIGKDFLSWDDAKKARYYFLKAFAAYPKFSHLFKYIKCYIKSE